MDTNESNFKSKKTINKLIEETVETTNNIGLTDKHPTEEKTEKVTEKLNKPFRKGMHASVYFVLAILIMNALIVSNRKIFLAVVLSIIISFTYACTDEYHQTFVGGRTGQFSDVLIDTMGSIVGVSLYSFSFFIYQNRSRKIIR